MKKALIYILVLILGIFVGILLALVNVRGLLGNIYNNVSVGKHADNKMTELYAVLDAMYVDSVDVEKIDEAALVYALEQLDPHSSYIPKEDLAEANEQLNGSFSGVGIQFNIQQDTIYVVDVVSGGPSERAGMMAGDRIVAVDDSAFVGKGINNDKVFKKLRGEKGSTVKLKVVRHGTKEPLNFVITRGDVPVYTVDAAHMLTDKIGYININTFGQNTYNEVLGGLAKINKAGAKAVIVDLRGNTGGYLDAAANIINEFLDRGDLIVYLEGRKCKRADYKANGFGSFQKMKLVVLIDEFSGSASEIFAGAIQDNDRGLIIGRRSFGKGLVQRPYNFKDGSELRITTAKYYTPSGRCIQKPYEKGRQTDYDQDIWNRYLHGEFYNADSIKQNDSVEYRTVKKGRIVYGGGGIMPDIFIPRDTTGYSESFSNLVNKTLIYRFSLQYTDKHRAELKKYKDWKSLEAYLIKQNLVQQLVAFAKAEGVTVTAKDLAISKSLISQHINSYIVRNVMTEDDFYQIMNKYDKTVQRAIKELEK